MLGAIEALPEPTQKTIAAVTRGDYDALVKEHYDTKSKTWLSVLDTAIHDLRKAAEQRKAAAKVAARLRDDYVDDDGCFEFDVGEESPQEGCASGEYSEDPKDEPDNEFLVVSRLMFQCNVYHRRTTFTRFVGRGGNFTTKMQARSLHNSGSSYKKRLRCSFRTRHTQC